MKKVAITIDPWKEELFCRGLTEANFEYTLTRGTNFHIIAVKTDLVAKLGRLTKKLNDQAAARRQEHN